MIQLPPFRMEDVLIGAIRVPGINPSVQDSSDFLYDHEDGNSSAAAAADEVESTLLDDQSNINSMVRATTAEDLEARIRSSIMSNVVEATTVAAARVNNRATADFDQGSDETYNNNDDDNAIAKGNAANSAPKQRRIPSMLLGFVCCVILIAIIAAVIATMAGDSGDSTSRDSPATTQVDDFFQPPATSEVISSASTSAPTDLNLASIHLDFLDWLKDNALNPEPLTFNSTGSAATTAQKQAFAWLANDAIKSADDIPASNSTGTSFMLERYALACFYYSTTGEGWTVANNWPSDKSVCEWSGITCNLTIGRVTDLIFPGNNLRGSIAEEIGHLTELNKILAPNNPFGSSSWEEEDGGRTRKLGDLDASSLPGLPTTIGLLTNLERIRVGRTGLGGIIPTEFGLLARTLTRIFCGGASFVGPIPSELGNLHNLWMLGLSFNKLTGTLPSDLGRLSSLARLGLESNALSVTIPVEYKSWSSPMDSVRLADKLFHPDTIEATLCNDTLGFSAAEITFSCPISTCSCCTECEV